ncbi:MAG: peptide deformylase [Verrucomicrobia bacterium]|nr:peptide deformylase [Verrucomicrobiota bacterium]
MILPVLKYGHPILRQKGARIDEITAEMRHLISDMKETMHAAKGIGLAAQQVGKALQLAVVDVRAVTDRPSTLHLSGQPAEVADFMPVILINPQVTPVAEPVAGPEGCLSFPEIYAEISRPESVEVTATNEKGKKFTFRCGGLLARAIQHEVDHLNGILFIDRMSTEIRQELKPELDELQTSTKEALKKKIKTCNPL